MKERPILFSGPMVRAILDGRKTQTRRVVKSQPLADVDAIRVERYHPTIIDRLGDDAPGPEIFGAYSEDGQWGCRCPYGEPADRLWVRETAKCSCRSEQPPANTGCIYVDFKAGGGIDRKYTLDRREDYPWFPSRSHNIDGSIRWTPGIHMPRWASRITLELNDVRIERLQDISEADVVAEGCADGQSRRGGFLPGIPMKSIFALAWCETHGARAWAVNPWVWALEFRVSQVLTPPLQDQDDPAFQSAGQESL